MEKGTVLFRRRGCGVIGNTVVTTDQRKVKGLRLEVEETRNDGIVE